MFSTDPILEIMRCILATSPLLLVYVLGIVIAVKRYRRHPGIVLDHAFRVPLARNESSPLSSC
jgi:hypothetical protein